ncbi:hypothetical protein Tco_0321351, partial [Tanacetum coccineum]
QWTKNNEIKEVDSREVVDESDSSKDEVETRNTIGDWDCLKKVKVQFRRTTLTGFLAQSFRSSNAIALDSPYLLVLITGTSQSRQHESRKSPKAKLFDVDSGRISIHHCWSGLPPFQYQRSRNEKADRNVLIFVRSETNFYREKSEWLGLVVPYITGYMMTCLQYQNHLCDYR